MSDAAAVSAVSTATSSSSSYRVKFRRTEFLELVDIARPKLIYRRKKYHFFAFDGFVVYSAECEDSDFAGRVIEAIELSNEPWRT